MDRAQKETLVAEIGERIERASVLYLTDFTGLSVKEMTKLRRTLKTSGAEYVVMKNRLARRVVQASAELPDIAADLTGPTGWVFGYDDIVATAKALSDFAREHDQKPSFKLGVMDQQVLQPEQIDKLAKLPSRDQLLAQLAGALEAPMAMLATALEAKLQETAGLIDALKEKRAAEG